MCAPNTKHHLTMQCYKPEASYKDLVFVIVCRIENKMCMIHRCRSCPRKDILYQFFKTEKRRSESTVNVVHMQSQWQSTNKQH